MSKTRVRWALSLGPGYLSWSGWSVVKVVCRPTVKRSVALAPIVAVVTVGRSSTCITGTAADTMKWNTESPGSV